MRLRTAVAEVWGCEMTIHYHGTPITPLSVLYELAGEHFCVSFARPDDDVVCHDIGQSVMLDNGAFSFWRSGEVQTDWEPYFRFCSKWLSFKSTWAVIPDVIEGSELENNQLIDRTVERVGLQSQLAPVWHLHEPIGRLKMLLHRFDRVCFGSSAEFSCVSSPKWNERMNCVFNEICKGSGSPPAWIHMLRGMSLSGSIYPFASVDSTDVARNHNRPQNGALKMARRWDALQCPAVWSVQPTQIALTADLGISR